jgi:small conductance mechanosensitive channel
MEEELQTIQKAADLASEIAVNYGFQFFAALLILVIGWQVSSWVASLVLKLCERLNLDVTLAKFFAGLAKTIVLAFVFIIALGKIGISIAPFIAALGAVVFGSTLALQGSISNYGAGLTIILTRPFVVGDTIRINDVVGIVEEIKLAYTRLNNEDGEQITIPNNKIIGEIIYNSSTNLIVEQIITISYDDDPEKVVQNRVLPYTLCSKTDYLFVANIASVQ